MPHGRPRKTRTWHQKRDKFDLARTPLGYGSWLRFVVDLFRPDKAYVVKTAQGTYEIQNQDPKELQQVLKREYFELVYLGQEGVEDRLVDLLHQSGPDALYHLWVAMTRGVFTIPLPHALVYSMKMIFKYGQEWPVWDVEDGEIDWMPLPEWEKEFASWLERSKH